MRLTILTSVLAIAVALTGAAYASEPGDDGGEVIQRKQPLPQPEYPDDQGYSQGYPQGGNNFQQNNVVIGNPGFRGYGPPAYVLPFTCITCFIDWHPNFTTVVAVGPNGRAQIVFANYPGPGGSILIAEVERMKFHGICRNLILARPLPCNGGCGGNGGGVVYPPPVYAQPLPGPGVVPNPGYGPGYGPGAGGPGYGPGIGVGAPGYGPGGGGPGMGGPGFDGDPGFGQGGNGGYYPPNGGGDQGPRGFPRPQGNY